MNNMTTKGFLDFEKLPDEIRAQIPGGIFYEKKEKPICALLLASSEKMKSLEYSFQIDVENASENIGYAHFTLDRIMKEVIWKNFFPSDFLKNKESELLHIIMQ